jgi:hypothetical protein
VSTIAPTPFRAFAEVLERRPRHWPRSGWHSEERPGEAERVIYFSGAYKIAVVRGDQGWREEPDADYRPPLPDPPAWVSAVAVILGAASSLLIFAIREPPQYFGIGLPVWFVCSFVWDQVLRIALHRVYHWPTLRQTLLLRGRWRSQRG